MSNITPELLNILVCPSCKAPVELRNNELVCTNAPGCGLRFPIRDDVPIMLISEALPRNSNGAN